MALITDFTTEVLNQAIINYEPTVTNDKLIIKLAYQTGKIFDPVWRIGHLYRIKHIETGEAVFPVLSPDQIEIIEDLYSPDSDTKRHIIVKARQVYMTTTSFLLAIDYCAFHNNALASFAAYDDDSTKDIFWEKGHFIVTQSPILRAIGAKAHQININFPHRGSKFVTSTSPRGGNPNFIILSDFGKTSAMFPAKATEMIDGSLAAAEHHPTIIESSSMGPFGQFHSIATAAFEAQNEKRQLRRTEFKLHFFPWHTKQGNRVKCEGKENINSDLTEYYSELKNLHDISLDSEQKLWYMDTSKLFRGDYVRMRREHPSTFKEAFENKIEGAILAREVHQARLEGRISEFVIKEQFPLIAFWDLGSTQTTMFIIAQRDEKQRLVILDAHAAKGESLKYHLNRIEMSGHCIGAHILPHDAAHERGLTKQSLVGNVAKSVKAAFSHFGYRNIHTLPKLSNKFYGIEATKATFSRVCIHSRLTSLIEHLELVSREMDSNGTFLQKLKSGDEHNHTYDCVEAMCRLDEEKGHLWHSRYSRMSQVRSGEKIVPIDKQNDDDDDIYPRDSFLG